MNLFFVHHHRARTYTRKKNNNSRESNSAQSQQQAFTHKCKHFYKLSHLHSKSHTHTQTHANLIARSNQHISAVLVFFPLAAVVVVVFYFIHRVFLTYFAKCLCFDCVRRWCYIVLCTHRCNCVWRQQRRRRWLAAATAIATIVDVVDSLVGMQWKTSFMKQARKKKRVHTFIDDMSIACGCVLATHAYTYTRTECIFTHTHTHTCRVNAHVLQSECCWHIRFHRVHVVYASFTAALALSRSLPLIPCVNCLKWLFSYSKTTTINSENTSN